MFPVNGDFLPIYHEGNLQFAYLFKNTSFWLMGKEGGSTVKCLSFPSSKNNFEWCQGNYRWFRKKCDFCMCKICIVPISYMFEFCEICNISCSVVNTEINKEVKCTQGCISIQTLYYFYLFLAALKTSNWQIFLSRNCTIFRIYRGFFYKCRTLWRKIL